MTRVGLAGIAIAGVALVIGAWPHTYFDTQTAEVTTGPIAARALATGTLQAVTTVDVGAPLSGTIEALAAADNTTVHAGDILARIDPAPYESRLRVARDALAAAQADGAASAEQITAAEANVHAAAADLEHTVIRSPVDGIVVVRNVDVGQLLTNAPEAPIICRIAADLHELRLVVERRPSDLPEIRRGDVATFTTDAQGVDSFRATVSEVSPAIVADVTNADQRLKPGMIVSVAFAESSRDDAIRIPSEALAFAPPPEAAAIVDADGLDASAASEAQDEGVREVWRFDHGRLAPVAVRLGLSGNGWAELREGALQPGDELATGVTARRSSWLRATWFP